MKSKIYNHGKNFTQTMLELWLYNEFIKGLILVTVHI